MEESGRAHFMTRRFDREADGKITIKHHMQTLCAMDHLDYKQRATHTYAQLFMVIARLKLGDEAPLPDRLTIAHIEEAANLTQSIIYRMSRNMVMEGGLPLQELIQGNNFSGLVSNIFSNSMDQCSPYKHNHDQRYPDLICKKANNGKGEGLEVKTTVNVRKGGESHNGHSGWHVIACYNFLPDGDIAFVQYHVCMA